jgi:hypothetical protein
LEELVPWALGLLVGIAFPRLPGGVARRVIFLALLVAAGLGVTVLSGEWSENPGYALVDIGQAWLAATIAMFARRHLVMRAPRRLPDTTQS